MFSSDKLIIKEGKGQKNFIAFIIHINKRRLQFHSLLSHEVINGCDMTFVFLQSIGTKNAMDDVVGWKRR